MKYIVSSLLAFFLLINTFFAESMEFGKVIPKNNATFKSDLMNYPKNKETSAKYANYQEVIDDIHQKFAPLLLLKQNLAGRSDGAVNFLFCANNMYVSRIFPHIKKYTGCTDATTILLSTEQIEQLGAVRELNSGIQKRLPYGDQSKAHQRLEKAIRVLVPNSMHPQLEDAHKAAWKICNQYMHTLLTSYINFFDDKASKDLLQRWNNEYNKNLNTNEMHYITTLQFCQNYLAQYAHTEYLLYYALAKDNSLRFPIFFTSYYDPCINCEKLWARVTPAPMTNEEASSSSSSSDSLEKSKDALTTIVSFSSYEDSRSRERRPDVTNEALHLLQLIDVTTPQSQFQYSLMPPSVVEQFSSSNPS